MGLHLSIEGFEDAIEVGWGAFAVVFRAWQIDYKREVAIKVVSVRPTPTLVEAFERECAAIGSLSGHPHIVTVHDVGTTADGRPFIIMEYLHGGSLADRLRFRGPLVWQEAAEVGIRLAGALETAHLGGVLHRDVKPENVLVSKFGDPKLGDFGIARLLGTTATEPQGVIGSVAHAAPEVLYGEAPTAASDIYSLGSTVFTLLAGTPPFGTGGNEEPLSLLARVSAEDPPDLRSRGVPDGLCVVLEQALAKAPAERQASTAQLGRQLHDIVAGNGRLVPAPHLQQDRRTEPALDRLGAGHRRRRWKPFAALSLGVLLMMAAVLLASSSGNEQPEITTPSTAPRPVPANAPRVNEIAAGEKGIFFSDDFSQPRPYLNFSGTSTTVDLVDGQYRVAVKDGGYGGVVVPLEPPPPSSVRLEVDVVERSEGTGRFGVGCGLAWPTGVAYEALIQSDGSWELLRTDPYVLSRWRSGTSTAIRPDAPNRLRLDCLGSGPGTVVTLSVNGEEVAHETDSRQMNARGHAQLSVLLSNQDAEAEVLFDNLVVSAL